MAQKLLVGFVCRKRLDDVTRERGREWVGRREKARGEGGKCCYTYAQHCAVRRSKKLQTDCESCVRLLCSPGFSSGISVVSRHFFLIYASFYQQERDRERGRGQHNFDSAKKSKGSPLLRFFSTFCLRLEARPICRCEKFLLTVNKRKRFEYFAS